MRAKGSITLIGTVVAMLFGFLLASTSSAPTIDYILDNIRNGTNHSSQR